jgi:hypothetical protein
MKKVFTLLTLLFCAACCFSQSRYISETTKKIVFTRDGGVCKCCGGSQSLEYDHIIPYSCGGQSIVSNIQLLCQKCNRSKSNSCYCKVHNRKVGINCCDDDAVKSKPHNSSTRSAVSKSSASTQCTGRTQKGSRCKKMTTNANGRCHLHT